MWFSPFLFIKEETKPHESDVLKVSLKWQLQEYESAAQLRMHMGKEEAGITEVT